MTVVGNAYIYLLSLSSSNQPQLPKVKSPWLPPLLACPTAMSGFMSTATGNYIREERPGGPCTSSEVSGHISHLLRVLLLLFTLGMTRSEAEEDEEALVCGRCIHALIQEGKVAPRRTGQWVRHVLCKRLLLEKKNPAARVKGCCPYSQDMG